MITSVNTDIITMIPKLMIHLEGLLKLRKPTIQNVRIRGQSNRKHIDHEQIKSIDGQMEITQGKRQTRACNRWYPGCSFSHIFPWYFQMSPRSARPSYMIQCESGVILRVDIVIRQAMYSSFNLENKENQATGTHGEIGFTWTYQWPVLVGHARTNLPMILADYI